jgi:hypothetical protein
MFISSFFVAFCGQASLCAYTRKYLSKKEGRKERRKEGRKAGRKAGRQGGREGGRNYWEGGCWSLNHT